MKERRQRTPDEELAISQLNVVTFPVASWDKRFYRSVSSINTITEGEAAQLWRIFIRYRRQMSFPGKTELLRMAEGLSAPDFRKQESMRRK